VERAGALRDFAPGRKKTPAVTYSPRALATEVRRTKGSWANSPTRRASERVGILEICYNPETSFQVGRAFQPAPSGWKAQPTRKGSCAASNAEGLGEARRSRWQPFASGYPGSA
jgi:hypothetical protein